MPPTSDNREVPTGRYWLNWAEDAEGRLNGIVDEEAGGAIAYANSEEHGDRIVAALNATEEGVLSATDE